MPAKTPFRVLLIGAYGLFGGRIARVLAQDPDLHLILAGRHRAQAESFAASLDAVRASIETAQIDTTANNLDQQLTILCPDLVIDTAGPFQGRDYRMAELALAAGAHYVDLADGRAFVNGIGSLHALAQSTGRWVISGASSVPGLHAAVIKAYRDRFASLESVDTAICPGNRTPRGWATTLAVLSYVGKPFRVLIDGGWQTVYGWQSLRRLRVPGVGIRWAARCEVPDLDVLPLRYPQLRTVDFRAGLELHRMHFGLWLGSWVVRARLIDTLAHFAKPMFALSQRWLKAGSDTGFMRVELQGQGQDGQPLRVCWTMIARDGDGPQIPATAAIVLARKLARGALPGAGATACLDLFSLEECLEALAGFAIETSVETTSS